MDKAISINKYLPLAFLYFFFNSFLLPHGLLYTTLLTPLLLIWLLPYRSFHYLFYFIYFTLPFVIIHLINGVDNSYYLRSYVLLGTVYIFCICFYQFLKVCRTLRTIFKYLLICNAIFVLVAIAALYLPSLKEKLWLSSDLSYQLKSMRLKLFTYEPSYYSLLLVPLALYYYLKALMKSLPHPWFTLILITVPLLLSLSFGIILGVILALLFTMLAHFRSLFTLKQKAFFIIAGIFLVVAGLPIVFALFPDNVFVQRMNNVFIGRDSSFKGRTIDAFYLGYEVARMKSILFGSGLGQVKVLGKELWESYYHHRFGINDIAIPNAMAETLAVFGFAGVAARLLMQVYFFFRTKVFSSYYRFALFAFAFVYQFTGSYIFNIAEYVIWILAFTPVFEEFDRKNYLKTIRP